MSVFYFIFFFLLLVIIYKFVQIFVDSCLFEHRVEKTVQLHVLKGKHTRVFRIIKREKKRERKKERKIKQLYIYIYYYKNIKTDK